MRIVTALLLAGAAAFGAENSFERLHEANQAFDRADYQTAVQGYQALLAQGFESGDLHFNLGNAYFRTASLGSSLFHFRRAWDLRPRDPDLRFNLDYAREKVADQMESRDSLWWRVLGLRGSVSEKEAYHALVLVTFLLLVVSGTALYRRSDWLLWARNGLIGIWAYGAIVVTYQTLLREPFGVVVVSEAKVYSGIGKDNVTLFTLHEGVEFVVADAVGGEWIRIRLSDGKQGWIRTGDAVYEKG